MNSQPKESLQALSIPVISCSNEHLNSSLRITNVSSMPSDDSIVAEIDSVSSRPGTMMGTEDRKGIIYSIASLTDSNILDQGALDDSVISVPLHLVQLPQNAPSPLPPPQPPPQSLQGSQIQISLDKNMVRDANLISSGFNGQIVIRTNADGTKSFLIETSTLGTSEGDGNMLSLEPKLNEDASHGNSLNEREVILQLEDDSTQNLNHLTTANIIPSNVILTSNGYQYISAKDIYVGDNQVFLSQPEGDSFENALAIDSIEGESVNMQSGTLMVTKLLKQDTSLDDKIPDTQTITIDKDHRAKVMDDVDPPIGSGPWTCKKCGLTMDRWPQFKKHEKKHMEDKPFACDECSESFNIKKNFELHMSIHNSEELKCPECYKVFRRLASFKAHLFVHQEEEILTCEICGDEFFSMNQLELHKIAHSNGDSVLFAEVRPIKDEPPSDAAFDCNKCGATFSSSLLMKNHAILHKRMKKLAPKPRRKLKNRSAFEKVCSQCGKAFMKPSQLSRHMRIHTGERPYKCTFPGCGRAFNQKGTMLIHMDIHSGKKSHKCELCGKSFVQKSNLHGHMSRVHPLTSGDEVRFYCAECPCIFKSANSLNAHVSRVHLLETFVNVDKNSNDVQELMKQLHDLESRRYTKQGENGKELVPPKDETSLANGQLTIADGDILQQALKNSGLAQAKIAAGIKLEKGTEEDEKKMQKIKIITVIDRVQEGVVKRYSVLVRIQGDTKWYMCDFQGCSKEFKKPSDLVRHIRVHTHEKPFKCSKCPRAFSIKATLMSHLKTHLTQKEFSCHTCSKTFTTASSLKTHSWMHTGTKPYQCSVCSKFFRTISHRKAHMLSHSQSAYRLHTLKKKNMPLPDIPLQEPILITNEGPVKQVSRYTSVYSTDEISAVDRPHKCRFCSAAFKKSSHLKQHERMHTGEKPYKCDSCFKTFSSQSVLKSHLKVHTGARPYNCQTCLKEFSSRGSLKRHLTTHSTARPYMCPYCHNKFKTNTNCKKHMKTHRQELAMNAIKAAGANLRKDSEQALLSSSLYANQQTVPTSAESQPECVAPETDLDSNSALQIHATFTQDLVDGSLTLTDFHPKDSPFPPPPAQSSLLLSNGSKILVSNPGDGSGVAPLNGIFIQPGLIFESYDYQALPPGAADTGDFVLQGTPPGLAPEEGGVQRMGGGEEVEGLAKRVVEASSAPSSADVLQGFKEYRFLSEQTSSSALEREDAALAPRKTIDFNDFYGNAEELSNVSQSLNDRGAVLSASIADPAPPALAPGSAPPPFNAARIESSEEEISREPQDKSAKAGSVIASPYLFENSLSAAPVVVTEGKAEAPVGSASFVHLFPSAEDDPCLETPQEPPQANSEVETALEDRRIEFSGLVKGGRKRKRAIPKDLLEGDGGGGHRKRQRRKRAAEGQGKRDVKEEEDGEMASFDGKFECGICRKVFLKFHNMNQHLKTHRNHHTCKQCGETVASISELKEHCKDHSTKICSPCNLTFPSQALLMSHIKKTHSEDVNDGQDKLFLESPDKNVWQCPVCKALFSSSEGIQKHLVIHSREEISSAISKDMREQAQLAASSDNSRLKLKFASEAVDALLQGSDMSRVEERLEISQPRRSKMMGGSDEPVCKDLPNQCKTCGKGFKKPSDLIRHIRTHTGEKPFACKLCMKKFAVKSTLDVHLRTHTGMKEHRCLTCNTFYSSKGSLKIHMRLHTGLKPLKCFYCGMKFRTSGHRKAHIAKHFRIQNMKESLKKEKPEKEVGLEDTPDIVGIVEGPSDDLLSAPVAAPDDLEGISSVTVNPDGTVTLQLNGMNFSDLDANSLLSLQQAVALEDAAMDPMQYCNTVSLELAGEDGEDRGQDISINPNMVMTQQRDAFLTEDVKGGVKGERREFEVVGAGGEHALIAFDDALNSREEVAISGQSAGGDFSHVLTIPYLPVVGSNNGLKCLSCPKAFSKIADWHEHMNSHNILVKVSDGESHTSQTLLTGTSFESDPLALNLKKADFSHKSSLHNCPYPNCPQSFSSEKDFQFHMDTTHNINYECSICKEVFLSQSSYQHHVASQHCAKTVKCMMCPEQFSQKEQLVSHISREHSDCVISQPGVILKNVSKASLGKDAATGMTLASAATRAGMDEDMDPLMIRDIFLADQ